MSEKRDMPTREDGAPWRNFYGRRHGKTLRKGQRELIDTRLATLAPPDVSWEENPERHPIDLARLFPGAREAWLEIGFGGGEHMIAQAVANPDVGIIGCEPFINGVAMLLAAIKRAGVENLRVLAGDARDLMDVLPSGSVGRAFLNYPDPWPKRRHHDRRFVNPPQIDQLARVLRPGAEFRVATDVPDYVRHALRVMAGDARFERVRVAEIAVPWDDWPGTRYEAKALREGRRPHYLTFRRL
ncbi:tRNA (guanosine(46)-N7)-methyltransferase TrmB [Limibaculum sp. FT325]|uniref:tRNA (guanosine(46)-N7)-methyltransferase TrmB n=1 Tax=Thermohalobaculum sediminis TaxID=2939436 RepID=UPI0020BF05C3|nr:tRNA (guanosine(46)-N7)-methyltransferase TrmB [Limibaculum sediminis]MCL5778326.1 tRNA (guanosine(46)-N7)-methyltransferase TrmB [Limibaculum sediminis]